MPTFRSALEEIRSVLGRVPSSPDRTIEELREKARYDLATALERELLLPREMMRPTTYMPITPAPPPPFMPSGYQWIGVDYAGTPMPGPTQGRVRPPAKEPTSTSSLGAAEDIDAEYAALVAELGVNSAAVDLETFKALVPRAGLRIYNRPEVQEYLHCKYSVPVGNVTGYVHWGWRPLRAVDRGVGKATRSENGVVQRGAEIYAKPIPFPVLLTVKAVRDACPSAQFFVSDEMQAEKIPDPFLLVVVAGEEFVIERWDEPGFRGKQ